MKRYFTLAVILLGICSYAQEDQQQPNDDQLQQQAPRETREQVERAALRDAKRTEASKKQQDVQAVSTPDSKKAKRKASRDTTARKP